MVDVLLVVEDGGFPPVRGSLGAACLDLASPENVTIPPHTSRVVDLKLRFAIPDGMKGELTHRSSLNFKKSMVIPTGVIDSDFRGSVKAKVYNLSDRNQSIEEGERFAQISFSEVFVPVIEVVDLLPETVRGEGGFGSTGTHEIITKEGSDGGDVNGANSVVGRDEQGESTDVTGVGGGTGPAVDGSAGDGSGRTGGGGSEAADQAVVGDSGDSRSGGDSGGGGAFDSDALDSPIPTGTPAAEPDPVPPRKSVSSRSKKKAAGAVQNVPKGDA